MRSMALRSLACGTARDSHSSKRDTVPEMIYVREIHMYVCMYVCDMNL